MKKNLKLLKERIYNSYVFRTIEITDSILDRVSYELDVIQHLGFVDYFLLYSRIIEVCNELNLIRSFGRGNASGSFINYCLDITKINPLEENLIFERFINPKRNILPDIDIDIPKGTQKIILKRLNEKYPEYKTFLVAIPAKDVKNIIHSEPGGLSYVQHCCGIVITNELLTDNTFLYNNERYIKLIPEEDELYNNKIDLVELEYLRRIQLIINEIGEQYHPYKLPLNDQTVFDVFTYGDTENIFQFNTQNLKEILKNFKPNSIRDLSIINAMYRPGSVDNLPDLIECKRKEIKYYWSDFRVTDILSETYGYLIYQETFYRLFNEIAGISLVDTDNWRKIIFKGKQKVGLEKFNENFILGCRNNSTLNEEDILRLLNLINNSFLFSFLKAHSYSYSTVAYWGAYYKTYHRKVFDSVFKTSFHSFELF